MKRIDEFPSKWSSAIYGTRFVDRDHSPNYYKIEVAYRCSFMHAMYKTNKEWTGKDFPIDRTMPSGLKKPHILIKTPLDDNLIVQFTKGGHWFYMKDVDVEGMCPSCDGDTETSYRVTEYLNLHDLLYDNISRLWWLNEDYEPDYSRLYELWSASNTYEEFRAKKGSQALRKLLLRECQ